MKHEGSVQLDIEFDASFSSSDNESDGGDEEADDDFHKIKAIEEEDLDNKDENTPLKDTKAKVPIVTPFSDEKKDSVERKKNDVNDKELTKILDNEVNVVDSEQ